MDCGKLPVTRKASTKYTVKCEGDNFGDFVRIYSDSGDLTFTEVEVYTDQANVLEKLIWTEPPTGPFGSCSNNCGDG